MGKYCVGVDFGTLSARALVVEVATGQELGSAVMDYAHGVMDKALPDGTPLQPDWALQHPQDYLDCLAHTIPEAIRKSGVEAKDVIGIGIDFTACTLVPVDARGTPMCFLDDYKSSPHAYVKLWKHHAAQDYADRLNKVAEQRGEAFLKRYGGKTSSEWMYPKIWQLLNEDAELYNRIARFMEAGDWVVMQLTGRIKKSSCTAGYKALHHKRTGYPENSFFAALDPRLEHVVDEKLGRTTYSIGHKAGEITKQAGKLVGLLAGTAVAVANVDAHVSVPASGIIEPGKMLMIMGTSTCHMLLGDEEVLVPGVGGVVEDGIIPGLMGYEAGQSCVGDHFNWVVENLVPQKYRQEAAERRLSMHELLSDKAARQKVGQHGILALDWWNGNRSVLVDVDLSGVLLGLDLSSKPEDIYRALIEATAYGTRVIIEAFEENDLAVKELYACGGIAQKNPLVMQIYADVCDRPIRVVDSTQAPALGSAMFGAVAAGSARGGYDDIRRAAQAMASSCGLLYRPIPENTQIYDALFAEYRKLHDYFGRGQNNAMKNLKRIKKMQHGNRNE